ncbi:MAG: hypothetical protein ACXVZV_05435 [Terriglobales bacterium]
MISRLILATILFVLSSLFAAAQQTPQYVGKESCGNCHAAQQKTVAGTPHETGKSCEGCHGPGEDHIRANDKRKTIFSFKQAPAYLVRQQCGQCHSNPVMARHAEGDVSCVACHSAHHYLVKKHLLRPQQDTLEHPARNQGTKPRMAQKDRIIG